MTRIRVMRVITRMNIGGPAINAALLTTRLDPERYETLLVSGREGPAEGSMVELGRVELQTPPRLVASLGRSVSPVADLRALLEVIRIARAYRPDIVHTHLAKAGFVGRIAACLSGAPVVVHTYHGTVFRSYFGRWQTRLFLLIEKLLARMTTRVIAITPLQRQDLIEFGIAPAGRIVEIPLGLDLSPFEQPPDRRSARGRLGVSGEDPLIVLVARLVPVKDVATFLRGVALLHARRPALRALVVGDGTERGSLETLARELGVDGICRFTGWRGDIADVYAAADVVALTSLSEGSPVSLIEAMRCGRPVVATAVGGVPDVVTHGVSGLLLPSSDPAALADAIERLLIDGLLRERVGAAARSATERFGADRLVRDIERLYEALLLESRT